MKIVLTLCFLFLSFAAQAAVPPEHRTCMTNADCTLVPISCCSCGQMSDMVAVNNAYADVDTPVCSAAQKDACSRSTICNPNLTRPAAFCMNGQCVVGPKPGQGYGKKPCSTADEAVDLCGRP